MTSIFFLSFLFFFFFFYQGSHDLIFIITGTGDDDELGLHKVLRVVLTVMRETVNGKVVDGDKIMKNFGKICLIFDAMFDKDEGTCLSFEVDHLMAQTKMKKPVLNSMYA